MQPWRVYVVAGAINDSLADALVAASRVGVAPPPAHFPEPLPEVYRARAVDFGARYYASLGIERSDSEARGRQTERNYSIFRRTGGAHLRHRSPVEAAQLDRSRPVRADVMIAAKARGISTCPQVAFAQFHDTIASQLQMPPEEITAFGMSMGYGDLASPVNRTRMPRERTRESARLLGFAS